jgi:hypothetical protein
MHGSSGLGAGDESVCLGGGGGWADRGMSDGALMRWERGMSAGNDPKLSPNTSSFIFTPPGIKFGGSLWCFWDIAATRTAPVG